VVGVIGKQGVGKSTILSAFSEDPKNVCPVACAVLIPTNKLTLLSLQTFTIAPATKALDHQTTGIDMYVTAERIILLDTQPVLSWSVLEHTLRYGSLDGIPPEVWRDLKVRL
jgi:ABC-type cobalamin/Fe3+-siderophores transport system ATPase subunit